MAPGENEIRTATEDVFSRLAGALTTTRNHLVMTRAPGEELAKEVNAGAASADGIARLIGDRQTTLEVRWCFGSARLKGGAPSAEKQPNQQQGQST
jgi:hypothetical protein